MTTVTCQHCGLVFESQRRTRKFCSRGCANRSVWAQTKSRECRLCGTPFPLRSASDAARQYCSQKCSKRANSKRIRAWQSERPEKMKEYRENQLAKNPNHNRERWEERRGRILALLGGECVVCGVTNPYWLHVDFIPTTRNSPYRHPRHYKYVSEHQDLFRLLCANHHYELTLTGRIEGTLITQ